MFDAIAFAGGGNRCYWQGGFYEAAAQRLDLAPRLVVGASAGAFAASYSLLGLGHRVRELVIGGCGDHLRNFDLAAWRRGDARWREGEYHYASWFDRDRPRSSIPQLHFTPGRPFEVRGSLTAWF